MRTFADVAALAAAKGQHLGRSQWRVVTQDRIDLFADATDDHQWIHVDERRAAEGPFGATVAHGFLSLSLLPSFTAEVYSLEQPPTMGINYGLNKVRFPRPVTVDSRIRDSIELTDARETDGRTLVTTRHTVEIDGEERPALVAETLTLFVP